MTFAFTRTSLRRAIVRATTPVLLGSAATLGAQQPAPASVASPVRTLSLDEAIRLAARESEELQVARAGIARASGQLAQARSLSMPQLNGSLAYARTLRSQFSALASGGAPDTSTAVRKEAVCAPNIPATATAAERDAALAQAQHLRRDGGDRLQPSVGFGAKNQYTAGTRLLAERVQRRPQRWSARGRDSGTADGASIEADRAARAARARRDAGVLRRRAGRPARRRSPTRRSRRPTSCCGRRSWRDASAISSEFDLLRATVTRDNQRPVVIQRARRSRRRVPAAQAAAQHPARRGGHSSRRRSTSRRRSRA